MAIMKGFDNESQEMTNHKDRWPIICLTVVLLNNQEDDNLFTNGFFLFRLMVYGVLSQIERMVFKKSIISFENSVSHIFIISRRIKI